VFAHRARCSFVHKVGSRCVSPAHVLTASCPTPIVLFDARAQRAQVSSALVLDSAAIAKPSYLSSSVTFSVYLFNVTNAKAVQTTPGVKPILQQVGPYTYTKTTHKFDVAMTASNAAVQFKIWTEYKADVCWSLCVIQPRLTLLSS
jgi:hypothetical protein